MGPDPAGCNDSGGHSSVGQHLWRSAPLCIAEGSIGESGLCMIDSPPQAGGNPRQRAGRRKEDEERPCRRHTAPAEHDKTYDGGGHGTVGRQRVRTPSCQRCRAGQGRAQEQMRDQSLLPLPPGLGRSFVGCPAAFRPSSRRPQRYVLRILKVATARRSHPSRIFRIPLGLIRQLRRLT